MRGILPMTEFIFSLFLTKIETNKVKKERYLIRQDSTIYTIFDKNYLFQV